MFLREGKTNMNFSGISLFFVDYEVTHFGAYRGLVNNGDVKSLCNWMTIPRVHPKVNLSLIGNTKKDLLAFSL